MKNEYLQQYNDIRLRLRRIHNLRRTILFARGTGLTLLALAAALGALAAGDHFFHWSVPTRIATAAGYYALLFLLGRRWITRAVRRGGGLERTARLVENHYADMDQSLVGVVQFAAPAVEKGRAETPEVFIEGMVGDAHGKLPEVKSFRMVRRSEAAAALLLLLLPLALLLVSFLRFPDFSATYAWRLLAPGWRNPLPLAGLDLRVAPGDARLLKGEKLTVTMRAAGLAGRPAILRVRPAGARRWRDEIMSGSPGELRAKVFPSVTEDFQYRVKVARDETPVYSVTVIRIPEIVEFAMTFRFPAYTGIEKRRLQTASGDITAPSGTEVDIEVAATRPLAEARVEFEPGEPLAINPRRGDRFRFSIRVQDPLRYRIALVDVKGVPGQSPGWYAVKPIPDKPPTVKIELPTDNIRATVVAEVPVVFQAEDDYGFSGIRLRYAIDDQDERCVDFDAGGKKILRAEHLFQIENMSLKPGNQVLYSVEALDNDTVARETKGRFKRAASELMFVMIQHLNQEYFMAGGDGGGASAGPKTDIIAAQRAVVRNTWPFVDAPEDPASARAGMVRVAEAQGKVREKALALLAKMRAKNMSPKAIAAMEKAIPLMEKAAAELEAGTAPPAFRSERAALAALLEAYDYQVAKLEGGGGSGPPPAKTGEKLEEVKINASSRLAPDEKKKNEQFIAGLAAEIERMEEEQKIIRNDMDAAKPPPKPPAGAKPAPSAGGKQQSRNELTASQQVQHLKERQEHLAAGAEALAGKIDRQPPGQKGEETLREIGDLMEKTRESMQSAAEALGRPEAADKESPQLDRAQESAQQAKELLAEAAAKAERLAGDKAGAAVEKALKELEALRADFEQRRAELDALGAPAPSDEPEAGVEPGADNKPGAGDRARAGQKPMSAVEAAGRLEKIADTLEGELDEPGNALAQAAKQAADSLRKSKQSSPGEGGGSSTKPPAGKKPGEDENKKGLGRGKGSPGGTDAKGSEGDAPDEGVGTGLTSRTLDELVAQFMLTPQLKEKTKQQAERRERPAVPYRDAEPDFFKRLSEEALP